MHYEISRIKHRRFVRREVLCKYQSHLFSKTWVLLT